MPHGVGEQLFQPGLALLQGIGLGGVGEQVEEVHRVPGQLSGGQLGVQLTLAALLQKAPHPVQHPLAGLHVVQGGGAGQGLGVPPVFVVDAVQVLHLAQVGKVGEVELDVLAGAQALVQLQAQPLDELGAIDLVAQ